MLEIVFDEDTHKGFLGEMFPEIVLSSLSKDFVFSDYKKIAEDLIKNYAAYRAFIIIGLPPDASMYKLMLALSVAAYEKKHTLESVIFKVKHSGSAKEKSKPYLALANVIRYVRDLMKMEKSEVFADIQRLVYLGLKIEKDKASTQIKLFWDVKDKPVHLETQTEKDTFIAIGLMKLWALCKMNFSAEAIIKKDLLLSDDICEDDVIYSIIEKARIEYEN